MGYNCLGVLSKVYLYDEVTQTLNSASKDSVRQKKTKNRAKNRVEFLKNRGKYREKLRFLSKIRKKVFRNYIESTTLHKVCVWFS